MRGGLGAGIVITSPKGARLDYVLQIHFAASNNVAEYEALMHGLKLAKEIGIHRILCFRDSDLVPAPVPADPGASQPDAAEETVFEIRAVPSWAQQFISYLADGELLEDQVLARQIECRAKAYTIINNELYKRSVCGILQRCVKPEEGRHLLKEIHQGECGHHASSRAIVAKAFLHGFYWPTVLKDAEKMVRACNGCQHFSKQRHMPAAALRIIPIMWPFAVWCLDMVGPFRTARSGMMHLLVMVDKFTKWIEAKPVKKLDGTTAVTFLKDIILRYGYPHSIITDNRTNFVVGAFARFCGSKGIRPRLIEPLEQSVGCWIEEFPAVLWSLRTTPNRSTGFTPFFLVYGAEAVLPADIEHDLPRVTLYTEEDTKEAHEDGVDLLEEARELALSRSAIYQQSLSRYHSRKVRPLAFREGSLHLHPAYRLEERQPEKLPAQSREPLASQPEGPLAQQSAQHLALSERHLLPRPPPRLHRRCHPGSQLGLASVGRGVGDKVADVDVFRNGTGARKTPLDGIRVERPLHSGSATLQLVQRHLLILGQQEGKSHVGPRSGG
ncbi:hypothetical protein ACQ4PT_052009 [Festuca glaucescens]